MKKTNGELLKEYHEIKSMMKDLLEHNRYREHEVLLPRLRELCDELIDWGFKAGETVERKTGRGWEEDIILKVDGSKFHFRTMIVPPAMIRRPIKNLPVIKQEEYEQISLFG